MLSDYRRAVWDPLERDLRGTIASCRRINAEQEEEIAKLRAALAPFATFGGFVEALQELDGGEPLSPHICINQSMGGGGSCGLYWSDFLAVKAALSPAEHPPLGSAGEAEVSLSAPDDPPTPSVEGTGE